jgi:hypothetical protein
MARTMSRRNKRFALALATVLTLGGAGAGFAYWTSTGSGTGSASTGASVAFTIASDPAVGTIAPGSAGQTVDFTVTNPGPGTQNVFGVSVTMADSTGAAWVPDGDCDIADYTATITTAPTFGPIPAGGTTDGTATVTLTNTGSDQDDCQGQTVPLYFVAS